MEIEYWLYRAYIELILILTLTRTLKYINKEKNIIATFIWHLQNIYTFQNDF